MKCPRPHRHRTHCVISDTCSSPFGPAFCSLYGQFSAYSSLKFIIRNFIIVRRHSATQSKCGPEQIIISQQCEYCFHLISRYTDQRESLSGRTQSARQYRGYVRTKPNRYFLIKPHRRHWSVDWFCDELCCFINYIVFAIIISMIHTWISLTYRINNTVIKHSQTHTFRCCCHRCRRISGMFCIFRFKC